MKRLVVFVMLAISVTLVAGEVEKAATNTYVQGVKVDLIKFKCYDSIEGIVIAEGFYRIENNDTIKFKGTENRYFKLSELKEDYFTQSELDTLGIVKSCKNEQ